MKEIVTVEQVEYSIDSKTLIKDISISIPTGSFVGIIGPNGSGKSTLLKTIYRSYKASKGCIYLNGKDINTLSNKKVAKEMAAVVQDHQTSFDLTVMEVMMSGQYAQYSFFSSNEKVSLQRCVEALRIVKMETFKEESFLTLSGGEKQRVMIASALARNPDIIVLDEPTNHLDISYQYMIMELLSKQDITILMAIHDLNLAKRYCDYIYVLDHGHLVSGGACNDVLTTTLIRDVFKMEASIYEDDNGQEMIHYMGPVE